MVVLYEYITMHGPMNIKFAGVVLKIRLQPLLSMSFTIQPPVISLEFDAMFSVRLTSSLTLRRLMSYIYMEHPFLMFLDHTQRRSTVGRTPLDE